MKSFIDDIYEIILKNIPLNPRDAFYGGRTGNAVLHNKPKEREKIKYIDICSLYPFVCKYGKFPIGQSRSYRWTRKLLST